MITATTGKLAVRLDCRKPVFRCFEGNYDAERMGDKQLRAGQALHRYLNRKYKGVPDKGHRYFPLSKITAVK